jgi:D-alanine-D-alanine ligase
MSIYQPRKAYSMPKRRKITIVYDQPAGDISRELEFVFGESAVAVDGKTHVVDTSVASILEQVEAVSEALLQAGYIVSTLPVKQEVGELINELQAEKPDLIFNFCESFQEDARQEMNVAGLYELLRIPYTGNPPLTLGSALNKVRTKEILSFHKINVPSFWVFNSVDEIGKSKIKFPVIAKPLHEDASIGISNSSIIYNVDRLCEHVDIMLKGFKEPVLVERYIEGREFNVAIVGNANPMPLPISEIDFSSMPDGYHHIVSYAAKWMPDTIEYRSTIPVCPAKIGKRLEKKIIGIALRSYKALGCRDYARVDMRVDKTGKAFVLEVNPNPDLSPHGSGFARSAEAFGWTYNELINKIVESAFERQRS